MSPETLDSVNGSPAPTTITTTSSLLSQLHRHFDSLSKAIESGDIRRSDAVLVDLVEFLGSVSDAAVGSDDDEGGAESAAVVVLDGVLGFISDPGLDQAVIDELTSPLLEATAKFAGLSSRCSSIFESVIDQLITKCHPRDMIAYLCGVLALYGKEIDAPDFIAPTFRGVAKVLASIKRRHLEIARATISSILNALNAACADSDDRDMGFRGVFDGAVDVATSIKVACDTLALISISMGEKVSNCLPLVITLSQFFPYCGLVYADLVTGHAVDPITKHISFEDIEDYMKSFGYVKHGAGLAVIWGCISDAVVDAAGQDVTTLKNELRSSQEKRWQVVAMVGNIFSMGSLPWNLKRDAIELLLVITDNMDEQQITEDTTCSFYSPRLIAALQAIATIVIHAPDAGLRKNAFTALKRVLTDSPASLRLDILQHLVRKSNLSSMVAILLDCARENLQAEIRKKSSAKEAGADPSLSFWDAGVLDLVEFVLRPPSGGPPSFPEQSDAVLSALNLYRFVLIAESTGNTNYTGVRSRSSLEKAYKEWLLPLRTVVTGIVAQNDDDHDELVLCRICSLNPIEFVVYRCIELVEAQLKRAM
ncbi:Aberrant root formation protein 4-like protein [Drosera capensis]